MVTLFGETFDNGSGNLTTGNSAFDFVGGTAPVFSTAQFVSSKSAYFAGTASTNSYGNRSYAAAGQAVVYKRMYIYLDAVPGATTYFAQALGPSSVIRAQLRVNTNQTISARNSTTAVWTSTSTLALNQWHRIEWKIDSVTPNQQVRLYSGANLHGNTPTEDSGAQTYNQGTIDATSYGVTSVGATTLYLDELLEQDTTWAGPIVLPSSWTFKKTVVIG